jgi:cysteine desulfurase
VHQRGQQARAAVDHAREAVAVLLNCRPAEVVFTSGGTESDNLALFGLLSPGDHLITTAIEHHAVLHAAEALAQRGVEVTFLKPNTAGVIDPETVRASLRPNTKLVSVMLANNETGVIQPVREIAEIAHAVGVTVHTDAVQAGAKLPVDVAALGCDLLSLSGHKMHAPQGVGVLFVRRRVKLNPLFFGGLHERGRRPGTENVAGIAGLGCAAELARNFLHTPASPDASPDAPPANPGALAALRDRLEQGILACVPDAGVNGSGAPRVANTTNLYFEGIGAEALVIALDLQGLAISAGSACQSGATEPSHVLLAMGLPEERARGSVRLSLSRLNSLSEIDLAIELVAAAVSRLRTIAGPSAAR